MQVHLITISHTDISSIWGLKLLLIQNKYIFWSGKVSTTQQDAFSSPKQAIHILLESKFKYPVTGIWIWK